MCKCVIIKLVLGGYIGDGLLETVTEYNILHGDRVELHQTKFQPTSLRKTDLVVLL